MNTSRRGAVIAVAMLAGTLGLSSLLAVSGPAAPGGPSRPIAMASTGTMGSLPRPSQVRPADVAVQSTPAPSPSAVPTAQPSTAATPRPTTVAAEPPSWRAPAPTPWPTPQPVATPRPTPAPPAPTAEATQFTVTVSSDGTVLGQSGPLAGTTATTTTWQQAFTLNVPAQGVQHFVLHMLGTWQLDQANLHNMAMQWTVVGTVGCDGNFRPIVDQNGSQPATNDGYLDVIQDNSAFYFSNATCPLVASFTVTASLIPAS